MDTQKEDVAGQEAPEVSEEVEVKETPEFDAQDAEQEETETEGDDSSDFITVQIGDETSEESEEAPEWLKELRRTSREKDKELKELRAKLESREEQKVLGPKPTLADCDYDNDEYEKKLGDWFAQKQRHDAQEASRKELEQQAEKRWQQKLTAYDAARDNLGVKDFEDAEAQVMQILDKPFPGINAPDVRINSIKQGAKNPAMVIYALGRNPKKAQELAEIADPIEFAVAIGELSATMKITKSKAPPPEKRLTGTGKAGTTGALDDGLERLREQAEKTGDYSKVVAYKRQQRQKQA